MKKTYTYSIAVLMLTLLKSIELIAQCPANVTITNGTGTWVNTASTTATVRITAVGAGGGKNTATTCSGGTANSGGSGATMVGQFTVASGATLYIIAGQAAMSLS